MPACLTLSSLTHAIRHSPLSPTARPISASPSFPYLPHSLLENTCEVNNEAYAQLMSHVGRDQQGGGGAMVINNNDSCMSAKHHTTVSSRTENLVNGAHAHAHVPVLTQASKVREGGEGCFDSY